MTCIYDGVATKNINKYIYIHICIYIYIYMWFIMHVLLTLHRNGLFFHIFFGMTGGWSFDWTRWKFRVVFWRIFGRRKQQELIDLSSLLQGHLETCCVKMDGNGGVAPQIILYILKLYELNMNHVKYVVSSGTLT